MSHLLAGVSHTSCAVNIKPPRLATDGAAREVWFHNYLQLLQKTAELPSPPAPQWLCDIPLNTPNSVNLYTNYKQAKYYTVDFLLRLVVELATRCLLPYDQRKTPNVIFTQSDKTKLWRCARVLSISPSVPTNSEGDSWENWMISKGIHLSETTSETHTSMCHLTDTVTKNKWCRILLWHKFCAFYEQQIVGFHTRLQLAQQTQSLCLLWPHTQKKNKIQRAQTSLVLVNRRTQSSLWEWHSGGARWAPADRCHYAY